jgi:hypothetical protein
MEVTTYQGLDLITTVADEINVKYLLDESGKALICDHCSGSCFDVKVLIEAEMTLSVSQKPPYQAVMRNKKTKSITAIKVVQCANCDSKEFIHDFVGEKENKS